MAKLQITKTIPHSLCDRQARQARSEALAHILKTVARSTSVGVPARRKSYAV